MHHRNQTHVTAYSTQVAYNPVVRILNFSCLGNPHPLYSFPFQPGSLSLCSPFPFTHLCTKLFFFHGLLFPSFIWSHLPIISGSIYILPACLYLLPPLIHRPIIPYVNCFHLSPITPYLTPPSQLSTAYFPFILSVLMQGLSLKHRPSTSLHRCCLAR